MENVIAEKNLEKRFDAFLGMERKNVLGMMKAKYGGSVSVDDIEDIVQEACLVVWEKVKTNGMADGEKKMKGFLYRVCCNMMSHFLRKATVTESFDDWKLDDEGDDEKMGLMVDTMMDEEVEKGKRLDLLTKVWAKLGEGEKKVIFLFYWKDKSMMDIAKELGYVNDGVAKTIKCRGMKMLREMMNRGWVEDGIAA